MSGLWRAISRGISLLEDGVALLRTAGLAAVAMYLIGTVPLVMSLLAMWGLFARTRATGTDLASCSLAIALSLIWAKCWKNRSAAMLLEELGDRDDAPWTLFRRTRFAGTQAMGAAVTTPLMLVSIALVLPLIWVWPFCHYLTILLDGRRTFHQAWRQAWRRSCTHAVTNAGWVLFVVPFMGLILLVNLIVIGAFLPVLVEMLLAMDTPLSRWKGWSSSPTWLGICLVLCWLAIDGTLHSGLTIHTFRDQARASGVDLLAAVRRFGAKAAMLVLAVAGAAMVAVPAPALAQQVGGGGVEPGQVDDAIEDVFRQRKYGWRKQRSAESDATFLDDLNEWMEEQKQAIAQWWEEVFGSDEEEPAEPDVEYGGDRNGTQPPSGEGLISLIQWLTVILLVAAIGAAAWVVVKRMRDKPVEAAGTPALAAADEPDVSDETVTADQLPEDDWLALARRLEEEGKPRLALRALFLSDLAHLARRDLLDLAKHKSNRDYLRELQRRSRYEPSRPAAMERNTRLFERCWYGRHAATPELLTEFRGNQREVRTA